MKVTDFLNNFQGMTFKDLISNIRWAKMGLALDIEDPWKRREVEDELNARGIEFIGGCSPDDRHYVYAIIGGKKDAVKDFVIWFKTAETWKYYIGKHTLFRTDIVYLVV